MKNAFDGLICGLVELRKESELEDISAESPKTEKQREQALKKIEQNIQKLWKCGTTTRDITYRKWEYQKEKKREKGTEDVFDNNNDRIFPHLMSDTKPYSQETQRTPVM